MNQGFVQLGFCGEWRRRLSSTWGLAGAEEGMAVGREARGVENW